MLVYKHRRLDGASRNELDLVNAYIDPFSTPGIHDRPAASLDPPPIRRYSRSRLRDRFACQGAPQELDTQLAFCIVVDFDPHRPNGELELV